MNDFLHEEHERAGPVAWVLRGVLVTIAGLGVWFAVARLGAADDLPPPAKTHSVSLLDAPPPPPPEDLPEPEEPEYEDAPEEMITETVDEAPAPDVGDLGVIGEGIAGADAFGLRGRKDGIDAFRALQDGNGGGGSLAHQLWSNEVGSILRMDLEQYPQLRRRNYRVELAMRFDEAGECTACRLLDTTGDPALDKLIEQRCSQLSADAPPPDLQQPIRLAVNVRGAE